MGTCLHHILAKPKLSWFQSMCVYALLFKDGQDTMKITFIISDTRYVTVVATTKNSSDICNWYFDENKIKSSERNQ